jgi:hypothetical protein
VVHEYEADCNPTQPIEACDMPLVIHAFCYQCLGLRRIRLSPPHVKA